MTYNFPCTQCGICCKNISHIVELQGFDLGNGICRHLDLATNACKIYENRPEICNVSAMYEKHFFGFHIWDDFLQLNAKSCNAMQEKYGIDVSFRVG